MASPWLKRLSAVVTGLLTATSLLVLPESQAQAAVPTNDSSCLFIDQTQALVSADFCIGDVVIPASVRTIKSNAFVNFKGAISFEANSQLQTVERLAFHGGASAASIVFPPSVTSVADFAFADTGSTVVYLEGSAAAFGQNAIWQRNVGTTFVQARGATRLTQGLAALTYQAPFQIDCSRMSGNKDFIGVSFVALELHNCRHPRSPSVANPPSVIGHILNREINESVTLQSIDGTRSAVIRLRQLGGSSIVAGADVSGAGFSISAFGDEFDLPQQNAVICQLGSGASLPSGVTLTSDCRLVAASTASIGSSTTDTTITWTANPGASNSVDVATNSATPTQDASTSGSASVRISLRKTTELSATQYYQMLLLAAQYSGSTRDWNSAIAAYRVIPSGGGSPPAPHAGIEADDAVKAFELGQTSQSLATSAVNSFASSLTGASSFLTELRSRIELQAAKNTVAAFESSGGRAQVVRQQILALPASETRLALLARFNTRAGSLLQRTTGLAGNIRTYVFSNPYALEQLTIPVGVTELTIDIQGAEGSQGGDERSGRPAREGFKGLVSGQLAVTPGQLLTVAVGESGYDGPSACIPGGLRITDDPLVAKGGTNPLGGYAGGNGGSPGVDSCVFDPNSGGGYGGAGGAASVVQVGDSANRSSIATLVAGGSAGSGGSTWAGPRLPGAIGLSTFTARADQPSTDGQSGQAFNHFVVVDDLEGLYEPFITGSAGGGGGGATGGIRGDWTYSTYGGCPTITFCFGGSSPGGNSTAGLNGVTQSYVPYTFDAGMQSNGRVTVSFVEPPAPPTPTPPTPPTPTPPLGTDPADTSPPVTTNTPDAPRDIKAVALWKSAEVSWRIPIQDGGSAILEYEVTTPNGQKCTSIRLTCKLTGLEPGQLLELSVRAKNSIGFGPAAKLGGNKIFIPLSMNLWQVKHSGSKYLPKLMNPGQLENLKAMLQQDTGGFVVNLRLARNASKLSSIALTSLMLAEVKALKSQLSSAGLVGKVKIQTTIQPPNTKAAKPSFILLISKP